MGQVIAITSGKGGTGKTTLCAGIGACLAAEGKRVLCIDADMGLRNLDISLGMSELAPISFVDVLAGRYSLSEATRHPAVLPAICARGSTSAPLLLERVDIRQTPLRTLLRVLERVAELLLGVGERGFFLVGIGDGFQFATLYADRILIVATPDPASLRDAGGTADRLRLMGKNDLKLVVNRVTPALFRSLRWTVDDMMDQIGLPLLGIIPEDERVVLAAAENLPLILYTDLGASLGCLHIARRLQGRKVPLLKIH